jgi:hypothetical protein
VAIDNVAHTIVFTAPTDGSGYIAANSSILVGINNEALINPATPGSYPITLSMISDDGLGGQNREVGEITVPIVDSDQVNITSFINTFIDFDIDTGTTDTVSCAYNACQLYAGGPAASNYTVDLGELNSTYVNMSQGTAVAHADGQQGAINSIYLNLITNAYNGAVVTVSSANGGLQGPDTNMINSVTDGNPIGINSGLYGFVLPVAGTGNGTVNRNSNCSASDFSRYCGLTTLPKTVFDTANAPLDYGRLRMDLAAAASYVNNPGAYSDTLTFIATATY